MNEELKEKIRAFLVVKMAKQIENSEALVEMCTDLLIKFNNGTISINELAFLLGMNRIYNLDIDFSNRNLNNLLNEANRRYLFEKLRKSGLNIAAIEMCTQYLTRYEQRTITVNELNFLQTMNRIYKLNLNIEKNKVKSL